MSYRHINATPGSYAQVVILCGDPHRVEWIAQNFLQRAIVVNTTRGMIGITGYYRDRKISIQCGGMGQASTGIYAHELWADHDVRTIIRLGTCGGVGDVNVGHALIATSAVSDTNMWRSFTPNIKPSPTPDIKLLHLHYSSRYNNTHYGCMYSTDLYWGNIDSVMPELHGNGVLGVDMETYWLYNLATLRQRSALSICVISNIIGQQSEMSPQQRVSLPEYHVINTLETAILCAE